MAYTEGDTYSYRSVHADDDRVATATDLDVQKARREDD